MNLIEKFLVKFKFSNCFMGFIIQFTSIQAFAQLKSVKFFWNWIIKHGMLFINHY